MKEQAPNSSNEPSPIRFLVPYMRKTWKYLFRGEYNNVNDLLAFVHYFHSNQVNLWIHFICIIPFFSAMFVVLESLCAFCVSFFFGSTGITHVSLLWITFSALFSLSIDRLPAIALILQQLVSYKLANTLIVNILGNQAASIVCFLSGLILLLFVAFLQLFIGHFTFEKRNAAFEPLEALLVAPFYATLRCIFTDTLNYKSGWKKEIIQRGKDGKWQKYARYQSKAE